MKPIKNVFPIFVSNPDLVYLDSASTTQTPQIVLDAMSEYYTKYRANIHRGVYTLSGEATELYENARASVAKFIGSDADEIVFTSGTTHGLNMLAQTLGRELKAGDNVVLTRMEHHANLIPWQEMSRRYGFEVRFIELTIDFRLQTSDLPIDKNTKIVSFALVSNTLGTINPAHEIIEAAQKVGATTIIDAAQAVPHMPIDVKLLDCDFLVFSGHKMYGPTGIGVLYGKRERLEAMPPFFFGGDMIKEVTYEKATWHDVPWKFEAGTPNIAGAIGLASAVQFIEKIGFREIQKHERELTEYALVELHKIKELKIIGLESNLSPANRPHPTSPGSGGDVGRLGVISFTLANIHPHDIASILDQRNIAVRAGHHCTKPLMQYLGISGTTRASFGLYNSKEDVDRLVAGVQAVLTLFK